MGSRVTSATVSSGVVLLVVLLDLLEVEAGDLEAVEEQAGAARVEGVGGDALQDLADGVLDGAAVFGQGEEEGGVGRVGWAGGGVGRVGWVGWVRRGGGGFAQVGGAGGGAAGGVVVIAEIFLGGGVAQAGGAAAAAVGEDVAALEAAGWGAGGVGHEVSSGCVLGTPPGGGVLWYAKSWKGEA